MRTLELQIGGEVYSLAPNWAASLEIAERVCDPITIASEVQKAALFERAAISHRPRFEFGLVNSVRILGIAARASGYKVTDEALHDAFVRDSAVDDALGLAADFIGLIVKAGPETYGPAAGEAATPGKPTPPTGAAS